MEAANAVNHLHVEDFPSTSPPRFSHATPEPPQISFPLFSFRNSKQLVTLHKYKRLLNEDSPQASSALSFHRLRRKTADSNLTVKVPISSPPSTPPQDCTNPHFLSSLCDCSERLQALCRSNRRLGETAVAFSGEGEYCLDLNVTASRRQHSTSRSFANRIRSQSELSLESSDEHSLSLNQRGSGVVRSKCLMDLAGSVPDFDPVQVRTASTDHQSFSRQLRAEKSDSDFLSTDDLTNSSSFSLSRFPLPPQLLPQFRNPTSPATTTLDGTPATSSPATPTTIQFRGASFDLLNPHKSLNLSKIVTPGDGEKDYLDYFDSNPIPEFTFAAAGEMASPFSDPEANLSSSTVDRVTRPRVIYDDLSSAVTSIRSRPRQGESPVQLERSPEQQSQPAATIVGDIGSSRVSDHGGRETAEPSSSPTSPAPKTSTPKRIQEYLSKVLHPLKKASTISSSRDQSRDDLEKQAGNPESTNTTGFRDESDTGPAYGRSRELSESGPEGIVEGGQDPRFSFFPGDDQIPQYDVESVYPSSIHQVDSRSLYAGSQANRQSVPYGVRVGETDYSSDIDTNPYINDDNATAAEDDATTTIQATTESTVGSIINRYQEADSSPYRQPPPEVSVGELSHHSERRKNVVDTQHYDGFNFGIPSNDQTIASASSDAQGGFPERSLRRFPASAGSPPTYPPPLQPAFEYQPPKPAFIRRETSATSDLTSFSSSYGDTRDVLRSSNQQLPGNGSRGRFSSNNPYAGIAFSSSSVEQSGCVREGVRRTSADMFGGNMIAMPLERSRSTHKNSPSHDLSQVSSFSIVDEGGDRNKNAGERISDDTTRSMPAVLAHEEGPAAHESAAQEADAEQIPDRRRSDADPKALGNEGSVVPKIWRDQSRLRAKLRVVAETSAEDGEEEGEEWETIIDSSRPELESSGERLNDQGKPPTIRAFDKLNTVVVHPGNEKGKRKAERGFANDGEETIVLRSKESGDEATILSRSPTTITRPQPIINRDRSNAFSRTTPRPDPLNLNDQALTPPPLFSEQSSRRRPRPGPYGSPATQNDFELQTMYPSSAVIPEPGSKLRNMDRSREARRARSPVARNTSGMGWVRFLQDEPDPVSSETRYGAQGNSSGKSTVAGSNKGNGNGNGSSSGTGTPRGAETPKVGISFTGGRTPGAARSKRRYKHSILADWTATNLASYNEETYGITTSRQNAEPAPMAAPNGFLGVQTPSHENSSVSDVGTTVSWVMHHPHAGSRTRILEDNYGQVFDLPHLSPHPRASVETPADIEQRKRLSWYIFAACCLFPPALVCYGAGAFDSMIVSLSRGRVREDGRYSEETCSGRRHLSFCDWLCDSHHRSARSKPSLTLGDLDCTAAFACWVGGLASYVLTLFTPPFSAFSPNSLRSRQSHLPQKKRNCCSNLPCSVFFPLLDLSMAFHKPLTPRCFG